MTDAGLVCALPDRSAAADVRKYQDALVIREILHTARTIAIVGLSSNVLRPSYFVGFYLQRHGYRIVPVNPNEREVLGEKAYSSLSDIPFHVDVVDVFRAPAFVPAIAEEVQKETGRPGIHCSWSADRPPPGMTQCKWG